MEKLYNKFICLLFAGLMWSSISVQAQKETAVIRGTITTENDKLGIPGASVVELDKDNRIISGTTTDMNGNYSLKVTSLSNKVSISFIGYKTAILDINNQKTINYELALNTTEIGTVEITAKSKINNGFMNIDERNLTTAVQTISMKELEGVSATSIDEALQGRIAGMDIVANSGDPGAGMSIRIRGTSSINASNQPLIVIDNIPYDTQIDKDFDFASADEERYAQMLNIAPENIKQISVLKDAAATAVWGSRAANGVLMITTKRGFIGKPKVQYALKTTLTWQPNPIPLLNGDQYTMMIREAFQNPHGVPMSSGVREFQYDPTWDYYQEYSQNTDWVKAITQTGFKNQHNLSLTGGGQKARYRMSVNYNNSKGTTIGTGARNLTTLFNLDYVVSDKLSFSTDLSYSHGNVDNSYVTKIDGNEKPKIREVAYQKMPNQSIYQMDSLGNQLPLYFSPESNAQGSWPDTYNPVAMANEAVSKTINDRVIPKFNIKYDISKVFRYTLDISFDINNEKSKKFLPQIATGKTWNDSYVNRTTDNESVSFLVQTFNKLFFVPNLGEKHQLTTMASVITYDKKSMEYSASTTNTASIELQDPMDPSRTFSGTDASLGVNNGTSQSRNMAGLLFAHYVLLDRYIISGSIRRDGDSKFGKNYQFGNFPSISGRWKVSNESFMKKFTFINELSLRASYGVNGNPPDKNYLQYSNYSTYSYLVFNERGVYPINMELLNLKWEKTIQRDLGFNLILFNERVNIDMDFYLKKTKDQIDKDRAIPSISGFDKITMNIGTTDNKGWELSVFSNIIRKENFSVDFNFNIARNRNIIRSRPLADLKIKGKTTSNGEYLYLLKIDNPVGSFYGYRYKGVYADENATIAKDENENDILDINNNPLRMQFNYPYSNYTFQAGDAMYEDINHDGNINYLDVVYLGNAYPLYEGGFGPTIRYKNISLVMFFHYRYGNDIINKARMNSEKMYDYSNQSTATLRRWRHPGDQTDVPRALYRYGYNWLGSDRFVEDGSFLRLKNITLTYNLPKKIMQKIKFADCKIFLTGTNIWTLTRYLGQDPEISYSNEDPFKSGIDGSSTPIARELMLGVTVGF
jgi:TonB-linked SusC/RagA family outer membrane protein